jgi:hypothetical protein
MLSTGQETGHFQAFQLKTTISSSKSNENINVNSLPRYDDYISTVNNYFVPKTQKVNNLQNMNYFLDEYGERINILSKKR